LSLVGFIVLELVASIINNARSRGGVSIISLLASLFRIANKVRVEGSGTNIFTVGGNYLVRVLGGWYVRVLPSISLRFTTIILLIISRLSSNIINLLDLLALRFFTTTLSFATLASTSTLAFVYTLRFIALDRVIKTRILVNRDTNYIKRTFEVI